MTRLITADASQMNGADFYYAATGRAPKTRGQNEAYWAERRKQARAELEQLRDRLCALASPELAAEWRAKWAAEDAMVNNSLEPKRRVA